MISEHTASEEDDDDSTIDGANLGIEESGHSLYKDSVSCISSVGSVNQDDDDSCHSFADEESIDYADEYGDQEEPVRTSEFYSFPAKRMSTGEMETVLETVFRSYNSLSQYMTKKPSERKLSFAAAIVEQKIFDNSTPACETARGCLSRLESWAQRDGEESVVETSHDFVTESTHASATKPKQLKSILKKFNNFSKPRPLVTRHKSEGILAHTEGNLNESANNLTVVSGPARQLFHRETSFFRKKFTSKPIGVEQSPKVPKRQLSLRSLFQGNEAEEVATTKVPKDICLSPPQRPKRHVSIRNLFQKNADKDTLVTPPSRKPSQQLSIIN